MTTPIDSSSSAAGLTQSVSQATGGQAMGKDAFLKLLVAQIRNQDPLKPQDSTQFVAELAQFSSLEQTMGINERLDLLALQSRGLQNTEVVGMVGKLATVRGSMLTIDGSGTGAAVGFTLDGESTETKVVIRDQSGRTVRSLDLGARNAGTSRIQWDGRSDAGQVQPAGTYVVEIEANTADGSPVTASQQTSGIITGVSFDKGYPVLHLDNGTDVPISDLLRVDSTPVTPSTP
jgi:flagellar basal-body rod modification protein FlgD